VEERLAAVMFTDLVNSTETFGRLSLKDADEVRQRHFDAVRKFVSDHRGELVKTLGDGVMATFTAATDALDVAVLTQQHFQDPATSLRLPGLRIGLSLGQVSVADGDCHGPAVNEAARLCQAARPGGILCARTIRVVIGPGTGHTFADVEPLSLKGLDPDFAAVELLWPSAADARRRVVLADDSVIVRQGIARLLESEGFDVVGEAGDADRLRVLVRDLVPDLVVTDIRMPPNMRLDGLEAALDIRRDFPRIGILVLSQHIETNTAMRLLDDASAGIGYLLKERITAIEDFAAAVRRVAGG